MNSMRLEVCNLIERYSNERVSDFKYIGYLINESSGSGVLEHGLDRAGSG